MGIGSDAPVDRGKGHHPSDEEEDPLEPQQSTRGVSKLIAGQKQTPSAGASQDTCNLRRHVCHILGVEAAEGEALVPGHGVGSPVTRIDWARVGAVADAQLTLTADAFDAFDGSEAGAEEQAATEDGANGRAGDGVGKGKGDPAAGGSAAPKDAAAAAAAAESSQSHTNDSADLASAGVVASTTSASDLTAQLFGEGGVSSDAEYRRVYNSAGGRIGPPRAEVDRAHLAGDVR